MRAEIQFCKLRSLLLSPLFTEARRRCLLRSKSCSLPRRTLAELTKVFGPAKPLLLRVGDRQPVRQTLVVPQRQRLWLVSRLSCTSVFTSCSRYNDTINIVPHITKIKRALLVAAYPHSLLA